MSIYLSIYVSLSLYIYIYIYKHMCLYPYWKVALDGLRHATGLNMPICRPFA